MKRRRNKRRDTRNEVRREVKTLGWAEEEGQAKGRNRMSSANRRGRKDAKKTEEDEGKKKQENIGK
jgi:hypothetical protein